MPVIYHSLSTSMTYSDLCDSTHHLALNRYN